MSCGLMICWIKCVDFVVGFLGYGRCYWGFVFVVRVGGIWGFGLWVERVIVNGICLNGYCCDLILDVCCGNVIVVRNC